MNKKKILYGILICILAIAIIAGIAWGVKIYLREQDPRWQMAKEIYKVQTALQEVDEDWKLESLSDVRPFVILGPKGISINYYCCITSYMNEEPTEINGLNKTAISQVVDVDTLKNYRDCEVNGMCAIMGELEGKTYLCWTISPKYSCVIEYSTGAIAEADIFQIAQNVEEKSVE